MKRVSRVTLSTLALAAFLIVPTALAESASGGFHVATDDGTRNIEFHGTVHPNGSASGQIRFLGPLAIPDQDVDGDGTGCEAVIL